jgi:Holliday junction resolvase-like predicted endonuclease
LTLVPPDLFERFIARILESEGYTTQVGVVLAGRCVTHEVDVVADRDGKHYLVECKYHNSHGRFCDVKIPLYIQARFTDIDEKWREDSNDARHFDQGWVVTNTRFTSDALWRMRRVPYDRLGPARQRELEGPYR